MKLVSLDNIWPAVNQWDRNWTFKSYVVEREGGERGGDRGREGEREGGGTETFIVIKKVQKRRTTDPHISVLHQLWMDGSESKKQERKAQYLKQKNNNTCRPNRGERRCRLTFQQVT